MNIENSMCYDITTDKFYFEESAFQPKHYKSRLIICDEFVIISEKHFNRFHKLMYKLLLGIKIENIDIRG